jgi:hypothetical protein
VPPQPPGLPLLLRRRRRRRRRRFSLRHGAAPRVAAWLGLVW